ncbi:head closure Hc1 [Mycobacterium phage Anthony]|uniref:Head-to-tail stopper n=1 Tax=Mycobacterium phage Anthony TaxID=2599857 RepID=A0A5J6THP5_9CAUD|nr:head closure Hc1 [Mycobacterium phage Anthony]QFG10391.1 head-to-tail stopper [Mycobacterium phage Anthony]
MSLLDGGGRYDDIVIYPEELHTDDDGNTMRRPSKVGILAKARFQVQGQSGTSARRAEQDNEGFSTEKVYRMRLPASFTKAHGILGAQTQIEWKDQVWALFGDVNYYNSSPMTAHVDYTVKRF